MGGRAGTRQSVREASSDVEVLLAALPRDARYVTVCDAHPESLSWLGGVMGHKVPPLGVEHCGQTGSVQDLYAHYRLDANAILTAAGALTGKPTLWPPLLGEAATAARRERRTRK